MKTLRRNMRAGRPSLVVRGLIGLAGLLVLKVTFSVAHQSYVDYFPPNFRSDFLIGREAYFWGPYHWAFYAHVVSGPISLVLGLILLSERLRRSFPAWHRRLGRLQAGLVLLVLTPSGLWMARYAATGAVAASGFATLSVATAFCLALGWRAAVQRRFVEHRHWMWRSFLLLCSAVVLRLTAGVATVSGVEAIWLYQLSAWTSWLLPLAVYEVCVRWKSVIGFLPRRPARGPVHPHGARIEAR